MDTCIEIIIIVAIAKNGVIGCKNDIPWHLKNDLQLFAKLTKGNTVIAGRKTHESIMKRLGHSLPNRETIVITRQTNYSVPKGCKIATTWDEAKKMASGPKILVIGGAEIYSLAIPDAKKMLITMVDCQCEGDAFFPRYNLAEWQEVDSEFHTCDESNDFNYTFKVLERKPISFVNLENARLKEQTEIMKMIQEEGFCPFCPEHYEKSRLMPILKKGKYWHIRQNRWPYENTRIHLVVIYNTHAEKISDLTPEAAQELFELAKWFETEYKVSGGGIGIRFGDPKVNGATVNHLHAHFITADITDKKNPRYKPVRIRVG